MGDIDTTDRDKLMILLEPIHQRAQMSARRLCRSQSEGDDLFQDAVVRALTRIADLRDDKAFPAWFYRILLSQHRTRQRRRFWRRFLPIERVSSGDAEPIGDDGQRWEESRQGARRLREALELLPAVQREAVVLFDIDGYSLAEVAAMQRASLSAVKTRLARGRARLRRYYERRTITAAVQQPGPSPETSPGPSPGPEPARSDTTRSPRASSRVESAHATR